MVVIRFSFHCKQTEIFILRGNRGVAHYLLIRVKGVTRVINKNFITWITNG